MIIQFEARAKGRSASLAVAQATPFADVLSRFLTDLQIAGRAVWTIKKHKQELQRYGRWLADRDWHTIDEDTLRAYIATRAHLGESSRAATICSLRVFYGWTVDRRLIAVSPAAGIGTPVRSKPTPKALKGAYVRKLLAYLKEQEGLCHRRDEALLVTALYTGLRAAELAKLVWEVIDLEERTITIYLSKMRHGRVVPVHPVVVAALLAWRARQAGSETGPVFSSVHDGKAITPARVGKIARKVARRAGIPMHAHILRHTFATATLKHSKDLYAVSKALGHTNIKHTEVYVGADAEQITEAVDTLPDLDEW